MAALSPDTFDEPRIANVLPVDVQAGLQPFNAVSGEAGPAAVREETTPPATGCGYETALLRVAVHAANITRGGMFKKVPDPALSIQLMKSLGDSDDPVALLDGAEAVGQVMQTTTKRRKRAVRWDEHFALRWIRDQALYSRYFVLFVLHDHSAKGAREIGHQVVRFANLPISVDDDDPTMFQGHWLLRRLRGSVDEQQIAGSVELSFSFEAPEPFAESQDNMQAAPAAARAAPAAAAPAAVHGQAAAAADPAFASEDSGFVDVDGASSAEEEQWRVALPDDPPMPASKGEESVNLRCPLPPGWVMCRTKKGRPFFVDHTTKSTTFDDPRLSAAYSSFYARQVREQMQPRFSAVVGDGIQPDEVPLPDGWDERHDVDGRKFYVDHSKKRTTWVHPVTGKRTKKEKGTAAAAAASDKVTPDFKAKLKKFQATLKEMRSTGPAAAKQNILISRSDVLNTSLSTVMQLSPADLQKTPYVTFFGERGLDYGGLQREWFYLLSHEIFNPAYGLFEYSSSTSYILQINPNSGLANPNHLTYFCFAGRIMGMAVLHGGQIDAFFVKPLYKFLLGLAVSVDDMQSVDPDYYKALQYVLVNDPADLNLTFSIDEEGIGDKRSVDLVVDGSQMDVTLENRNDYVQLVCERRFVERCREQTDALRKGFTEVVPQGLISTFGPRELEILIGGTAEIDVQDWRKHSVYSGGYTSYSPTVQWFWEAVLSYTPEQRARLLQFATASSRVPMNGFAELQGSNGPQRFSLRQWGCIKDLPRAHTCFNRVDLPAYNSFKLTREKLLLAIENTEGFDGVD
mmetsp:Transcript_18237/g.47620  ORF Transcript_18237/g.47620 Transcript_18237/m.47620 type:complete len:800 (-) Transcript_18237:67-2466(-)